MDVRYIYALGMTLSDGGDQGSFVTEHGAPAAQAGTTEWTLAEPVPTYT